MSTYFPTASLYATAGFSRNCGYTAGGRRDPTGKNPASRKSRPRNRRTQHVKAAAQRAALAFSGLLAQHAL